MTDEEKNLIQLLNNTETFELAVMLAAGEYGLNWIVDNYDIEIRKDHRGLKSFNIEHYRVKCNSNINKGNAMLKFKIYLWENFDNIFYYDAFETREALERYLITVPKLIFKRHLDKLNINYKP